MEYTTFYDAGPVITKASFIGFCHNNSKDACKHKACGWKEPVVKCPTCGREHRKSEAWNRSAYDMKKKAYVKLDEPIPCAPHGG
jgi:hypothetical protein